eukprot:s739_g19.t1
MSVSNFATSLYSDHGAWDDLEDRGFSLRDQLQTELVKPHMVGFLFDSKRECLDVMRGMHGPHGPDTALHVAAADAEILYQWNIDHKGEFDVDRREDRARALKCRLSKLQKVKASDAYDELLGLDVKLQARVSKARFRLQVARATSAPADILRMAFGTRRMKTLRNRARAWSRVREWIMYTGDPFPRDIAYLLEFLLFLVQEESTRGRIIEAAAALAVLEDAGQVAKDMRISQTPVWLQSVKSRIAELEQSSAQVKRARPPTCCHVDFFGACSSVAWLPGVFRAMAWVILLCTWGCLRISDLEGLVLDRLELGSWGLRGILVRTKTTGPGKNVKEVPIFISRKISFTGVDWMRCGYDLWKSFGHLGRDYFAMATTSAMEFPLNKFAPVEKAALYIRQAFGFSEASSTWMLPYTALGMLQGGIYLSKVTEDVADAVCKTCQRAGGSFEEDRESSSSGSSSSTEANGENEIEEELEGRRSHTGTSEELDYGKLQIGISERRTAWLVNFIDELESDQWLVLTRRYQEFHGRLGFTAQVLLWVRPLLAPGYAWLATVGKAATVKVPELVAMVCIFIRSKFKRSLTKIPCSKDERHLGELFRTDAKCENGKVVLGGWTTSGSGKPMDANWFSIELGPSQVPWLFRGEDQSSSWASTSAELLASLVALKIFKIGDILKGSRIASHVVKCGGGADNRATSQLVQKRLNTKVPLMIILMNYLGFCEEMGIHCQLDWRPRDANIEADQLTNGIFDAFDMGKRIEVVWEELDFPMISYLMGFAESFSKRKIVEVDRSGDDAKGKFTKSSWG